MKSFILILLLVGATIQVKAQYVLSEPQAWDQFPPEVQETGFGLHSSKLAQMDDDSALEEILLFSSNNGHYPYFDLFKNYYVIIDHYTKELKYKSDITISSKRDLVIEDRNNDGEYELYRTYFLDGVFSVDNLGNNLKTTWMYDRIECKSENGLEQNKYGKNEYSK